MTYFSKKNLDKYYTPYNAVTQFIQTLYSCLSADTVSECIEPSAGNGSFSLQLTGNCFSYDIELEHSSIIQQDFFTLPLELKQGRCFVGNPPFGRFSHLLKKFISRSAEFGDYIEYICNNSFLKWQIKGFDLLYSESFFWIKVV